jgi:hypothetical protein
VLEHSWFASTPPPWVHTGPILSICFTTVSSTTQEPPAVPVIASPTEEVTMATLMMWMVTA